MTWCDSGGRELVLRVWYMVHGDCVSRGRLSVPHDRRYWAAAGGFRHNLIPGTAAFQAGRKLVQLQSTMASFATLNELQPS